MLEASYMTYEDKNRVCFPWLQPQCNALNTRGCFTLLLAFACVVPSSLPYIYFQKTLQTLTYFTHNHPGRLVLNQTNAAKKQKDMA